MDNSGEWYKMSEFIFIEIYKEGKLFHVYEHPINIPLPIIGDYLVYREYNYKIIDREFIILYSDNEVKVRYYVGDNKT